MHASAIHHLGLSVSKLKESAAFFTECLGWEIVKRKPHYPAIFVSSGECVITLWQTQEDAEEFDRNNNVGLHHLALRVKSNTELKALFDRVKHYQDVSIEFSPEPLDEGPAQHFMINDPSGIRIEFICAP